MVGDFNVIRNIRERRGLGAHKSNRRRFLGSMSSTQM